MTLSPELARQLATAGRKSEEWRVRRDRLIVEASRTGASLRQIAGAVGLSNTGVLRVLRRFGGTHDLEADHFERSERTAEHDGDNNLVLLTLEEHRLRDGEQPEA